MLLLLGDWSSHIYPPSFCAMQMPSQVQPGDSSWQARFTQKVRKTTRTEWKTCIVIREMWHKKATSANFSSYNPFAKASCRYTETFSALYSSYSEENCPGLIKLLLLQCSHWVPPMSRLTNLKARTACSRSKRVWPLQDYSDIPLIFSVSFKISLGYFCCGPAGLQIGDGDWTSDWGAAIKMEQSWFSAW